MLRFQTEIRLAHSTPEVRSIMMRWLGFEVKLVKIDEFESKSADHAKNFWGFTPIRITCFENEG